MKYILAAAALIAGTPAAAQPPAPYIEVRGQGEAERDADYGAVSFQLQTNGQTSDAAVASLRTLRSRIDGLLTLPGVSVRLEGHGILVSAVRDSKCVRAADDDAACPILKYTASMSMSAETAPASSSGAVMQAAGRFGAVDIRFSGGRVTDKAQLARQAMAAAVRDARAQADVLASAAGVRVGPLLMIGPPQAVPRMVEMGNLQGESPAIEDPLTLKVPPVTESVTVTMRFALIP